MTSPRRLTANQPTSNTAGSPMRPLGQSAPRSTEVPLRLTSLGERVAELLALQAHAREDDSA